MKRESKQNGSGLATNQYEVVLTVGNVPKHTVVHFPRRMQQADRIYFEIRWLHELEIAGGAACVAAYRQAVCSGALRFQRTVEDRYHGVYERELVDVYAEVGFKNPSHFSTAFKKQYGILILL